MNFLNGYLACSGGVILSVIIPVLAKAVREQFKVGGPAEVGAFGLFFRVIWKIIRPYFILGAFSLAVSLLIVAFLGDTLTTWQSALLAGYLWDSTLQKITGKP